MWRRMRFAERVVAVAALATVPLLTLLVLIVVAQRWPWPVVAVVVWVVVWSAIGLALVRRRWAARRLSSLDPQVGRLTVAAVRAHPHTASSGIAVEGAAATAGTVQRLASLPLDQLEEHAVHSGSPFALRALALRVSSARVEPSRLVAAQQLDADVRSALLGEIDADAALALARATAAHTEPVAGLSAVALELASAHASLLRPARAAEAARLNLERGRRSAAVPLVHRSPNDWRRTLLAADLIDASREPEHWASVVGVLYDTAGIEPLAVTGGEGSLFERLVVDAPAGSVEGPLVSIIMTVWRPDRSTAAAVKSVLAQTWRNFELLILDDASGAEFDDVLDELERRDNRVRVIRSDENAGTYRRRDDGIAAAQGELVAFHDGDDLSHPRRIEVQATWMLHNRDAPGCVTTALRIGDDLRFSQPRGLDLRLCEPSIMVRADLLPRVGPFPQVRKGGDVEFRERVGDVAGRDVFVIRTAAPLTLQRWEAASLSGGDFASGWSHPARLAFRSAHAWARATRNAMPSAPDRLTGLVRDAPQLDVVIVADAREATSGARALRRARQAVLSAVRSGVRVGIMHAPAPISGSVERPFDASYHELIRAGAVEVIVADDPAHAVRAVVLGVDSLLGVSGSCALRADTVLAVGSGIAVEGELGEIAREALGARAVARADRLPSLVA